MPLEFVGEKYTLLRKRGGVVSGVLRDRVLRLGLVLWASSGVCCASGVVFVLYVNVMMLK